MKFTWKVVKIALAVIVIAGVVFWATDLVRSRSYSGANLNFDVAGGSNAVTNPSDQPIAVQLVGAGSRTFRVTSSIDDVSGSSTREGTSATGSHLFAFDLPTGTSEFSITGGADVSFVAETDVELQAVVQPMTSENRRTVLIAAAVVVFGALFYISNVLEHSWLRRLRGETPVAPPPQPTTTDGQTSQGPAIKTYGDNRTSTPKK
jgi:preprotein translocase subunit SecE